jgi:hypothetical protein
MVVQTTFMSSHFINLIDNTIAVINKMYKPTSFYCHYLKVKLQKAISTTELYDNGADISCSISDQLYHSIPPDLIANEKRASGLALFILIVWTQANQPLLRKLS